MRFGYVQNFTLRTCARTLLFVLTMGLTLGSVHGCKKTEPHSCEQACAHATSVVLDMVAAQGTLNSKALTDRSEEMQLSCQAECREGGLDPGCLASASNYDALQKCSGEVLNAPAGSPTRGSVSPKPAAEGVKAPVVNTEESPASSSDTTGQTPP